MPISDLSCAYKGVAYKKACFYVFRFKSLLLESANFFWNVANDFKRFIVVEFRTEREREREGCQNEGHDPSPSFIPTHLPAFPKISRFWKLLKFLSNDLSLTQTNYWFTKEAEKQTCLIIGKVFSLNTKVDLYIHKRFWFDLTKLIADVIILW